MINILPEFESRQVLTSDELNWLTCYLDKEARSSRRFLIGCGLIGGLQVKLSGNTVQISNGIGLTSAGHIVSILNNNSDVTVYTQIKQYTQQVKEKLAFHYLSDIDITQDDYSQSVAKPSHYFPGFKNEVSELVEDTENGAQPITAAALLGKVVILFAEIIQKELKDCEDDNCQERGKKYIYLTKPLVISKEDALHLLNVEYNVQGVNEAFISRVAFPWLHLPNVNILKPVFSTVPPNNVFDENTIAAEYIRCIKDFEKSIDNLALDQALSNLKNYYTSGNVSLAIVDKLLKLIAKSKVLTINNPKAVVCQVMYDFLFCFTKAYRELQTEAQLLEAKCFTREAAFPNHVLLGLLDPQNDDFDDSHPASYSLYRHSFQSRYTETGQALISKKISLFINRLQLLADNFDDTVLSVKSDIKITPGGNFLQTLSHQAVPYYLKPALANNWNQWAAHSKLNKYNTRYGSVNESQHPTAGLSYNTLPSAFQGNHSFFRIEGTHGQVALNALNTVFDIRKKHGLAFEVLMLRVNEKAPFSNSFNSTINEDIESMYQVVRAETRKQVSLNVAYLGSLQFKSGKFNPILNSLIKELEKSYMSHLSNINKQIVAKFPEVLSEAITASNITTNYRSTKFSIDPKYSELETLVYDTKRSAPSFMKAQNSGATMMKKNLLTAQFFQPVFNFPIGIIFVNTLGNLVNSIKANDKFKNTTEVSLYTHLADVVKGMQKTEKTQVLFLIAVRLYCALKLQDEFLTDDFLELDIDKYKDNLDNELLPACSDMIAFLKKVNVDFVRNDGILAEVIKGEMLDYADRIKFDDDWVKINQLDAENKKRNGGLGVENLFERFVKLHPGVAHGCGVPSGGTFIMVYDKGNQVIADFYLPYIISSHLRPIQYTLVENKTITISGTVKDESGAPVEASLLVGNAVIATDKEGFYNLLVNENSNIKLIAKAPGFINFEKDLIITNKSEVLNIILKKSDVKHATTVKFLNQTGKPVSKAFKILQLDTNKTETIANGVLAVTGAPKTVFKFMVKDENFDDQEFDVVIGTSDKEETITLLEVAFIKIQIHSEPEPYNVNLLKNIKVLSPDMEVDTSQKEIGIFFTKEKVDITKKPTANVIYNGMSRNVAVIPGEKTNDILFSAAPDNRRKIGTMAMMLYPAARQVPKVKSISVNKTQIDLDVESNFGTVELLTDGKLVLGKEFTNPPAIAITNLKAIKHVIFIVDAQLIADNIDIIKKEAVFGFTKTINEIELRKLVKVRREFGFIGSKVDLNIENFFCLLLPNEQIGDIRKILAV